MKNDAKMTHCLDFQKRKKSTADAQKEISVFFLNHVIKIL